MVSHVLIFVHYLKIYTQIQNVVQKMYNIKVVQNKRHIKKLLLKSAKNWSVQKWNHANRANKSIKNETQNLSVMSLELEKKQSRKKHMKNT